MKKFVPLSCLVVIMTIFIYIERSAAYGPLDSLKDKLYNLMLEDMKGCGGLTKTLDNLDLYSLRNPKPKCKKECGTNDVQVKYSGTTVICCCDSSLSSPKENSSNIPIGQQVAAPAQNEPATIPVTQTK